MVDIGVELELENTMTEEMKRLLDENEMGRVQLDEQATMIHMQVLLGLAGSGREYGMRTVWFRGDTRSGVEFFRGWERAIRVRSTDANHYAPVLFHTHPPHDGFIDFVPSSRGLPEQPFVGGGDFCASGVLTPGMAEFDGGYLNVVTPESVTFFVGKTPMSREEVLDVELRRATPNAVDRIGTWKIVEGGDKEKGKTFISRSTQEHMLKNRFISDVRVDDVFNDKGVAVLRMEEPGTLANYNFFVIQPGVLMESGVKLVDLCYGDGLKELMGKFDLWKHGYSVSLLEGLRSLEKVKTGYSRGKKNTE